MDAQEEHDQEMSLCKGKLSKGSRQGLEALLKEKSAGSSESGQSSGLGPIERAMRDNPALTRETAEKMSTTFGF